MSFPTDFGEILQKSFSAVFGEIRQDELPKKIHRNPVVRSRSLTKSKIQICKIQNLKSKIQNKKAPRSREAFEFHFAKEINSLSLGSFDIHGVESFLTFDEVESDNIVFFDFISQTTGVYEVLFSSALVFNKSESFGLIIEFDNTFVHCVKLFY
jgi:hypothetical protein